MSTIPRTARGSLTRHKLLEAAEHLFASVGYHDSSIVKITERAGVGLGTFYLYFDGKQQIFDEVVGDLNRRVRHAMTEASRAAGSRLEAERAGFRAFFRFTAEHPALYRIIRQAEFVSPQALRSHYNQIVDGYIAGLRDAQASGEVRELDPTVAAWALMGIGELIGMRWVLWDNNDDGGNQTGSGNDGGSDPGNDGGVAAPREVPEPVFEEMMNFIQRALAVDPPQREESP